jgi:tetratricopeptide (TPR) repeat protein
MNVIERCKVLIKEKNQNEAIKILEEFVNENEHEQIGAHRLLSQIYKDCSDKDKAIDVLEKGIQHNPTNLWFHLMLGDLFYFDFKDIKSSIEVYERLLSKFKKAEKSTMSPYRYVLKRLSNIYYETGALDKAKKYFEMFITIEPSDFYASDFKKFTEILLKLGFKERAKEVIKTGVRTHPGDKDLFNFAKGYFPEEEFEFREKNRRGLIQNVKKIPVKTRLIREFDNIYEIVDEFTKNIRQEGDIITISSCVAAMTEGRIYSVDTIKPSALAKLVSRFVSQKSVPFGGAAPLANPYAMEIAIKECGTLKIIIAAIAGIIGKILGKKGWFYIVAGPQSALIDDPPASIPPYDYAVIPGPENSFEISRKIKEKTGCRSAVVDANDLGDAWAVGYSEGIDKNNLEIALSDNPAENEDQRTPIVIVRGL